MKTVKRTVKFDQTLDERIALFADKKGLSYSDAVRTLVLWGFESAFEKEAMPRVHKIVTNEGDKVLRGVSLEIALAEEEMMERMAREIRSCIGYEFKRIADRMEEPEWD